jgi:hypothetical protein
MCNRATSFRAALVLWAVGLVASPSYAENMISKDDADFIFSLTRSQWEAYARRVIHPWGWETRVAAVSTGSVMMSIHVQNGMALSVRSIFSDDHSTPDMLIVGGWHVTGTSSFTESLKQSRLRSANHGVLYVAVGQQNRVTARRVWVVVSAPLPVLTAAYILAPMEGSKEERPQGPPDPLLGIEEDGRARCPKGHAIRRHTYRQL